MDILGIQFPEILLIMLVAMIIFGPEKLPEMMRTAGQWIRKFREMSDDVRTEVSRELKVSEFSDVIQQTRKEILEVKDTVQQSAREIREQYITEVTNVTTEVTSIVRSKPDDPSTVETVTPVSSTEIENPVGLSGAALIERAVEAQPVTSTDAFADERIAPPVVGFNWQAALMEDKPANPKWRGPQPRYETYQTEIIQQTEPVPEVNPEESPADAGEPPADSARRSPRISRPKSRNKDEN